MTSFKKPTHLENSNFNFVVPNSSPKKKDLGKKKRSLSTDPLATPKKLGTVEGPTTIGKPLPPELRKKLKAFKRRRET